MKNYHQFHIDFIGHKKIYFGISLGLIALGLICNLIFGAKLDIQFTGGAIVKYSYVGDVDTAALSNLIEAATSKSVDVQTSKDIIAGEDNVIANNASIEFSGNDALTLDQQKAMNDAITKAYPNNNFKQTESSSVDATNGRDFFLKCLVAVAIASILMVVYVAFRFKKISGWSAGVMALVALLHDVLMVYFTFVVFRMPIDDNFIAVVLMILGYSLNDTIIIYDRIRENRKIMGPKTDLSVLVNTSINQTFTRSINTSFCTFMAIATVLVMAIIFNLPSVITFALPMMIGVISGSYSTVCIAGPLWVMWRKYKAGRAAKAN